MNHISYYFYFVLGKLRRLYFMQIPENKKDMKKSRTWFIIDGCTSTTIINLVGGAFLASLLKTMDVSDSVNGTITAIISLGALAQIFGANATKGMKKIKLFVCSLALIHRVLFATIFFIPFLNIPIDIKVSLFVFIFVLAHFIGNLINPSASNWIGSLVPTYMRGKYMARRDLLSVLSIMIITMGYSLVLDYYKSINSQNVGFYIGGILVFALALVNFISLTSIKEPRISFLNSNNLEMHGGILKRAQNDKGKSKKESLLTTLIISLKDKNFRIVLWTTSAWFAAFYFSFSYFGIYQVKELNLSYTYLMAVAFGANIVRIIATPFIGKYADKNSWSKTLRNGLIVYGFAFFINSFAVPANGKIVYFLFMVLFAVAAPGVNLGIFNIQFELTSGEDKTPYIGINSALAGTMGFLFAILGGVVLDLVVSHSNMIFGIPIYGQQLLSFLSAILIFIIVLFVQAKLIRNS